MNQMMLFNKCTSKVRFFVPLCLFHGEFSCEWYYRWNVVDFQGFNVVGLVPEIQPPLKATWVFPKNRGGAPKWMVYMGKSYQKWMIWGENPPFKETPTYIYVAKPLPGHQPSPKNPKKNRGVESFHSYPGGGVRLSWMQRPQLVEVKKDAMEKWQVETPGFLCLSHESSLWIQGSGAWMHLGYNFGG